VPTLSSADLDELQSLDTCTVSNAIERLKVRRQHGGWCAEARSTASSPISSRCFAASVFFTVYIVPAAYVIVYSRRRIRAISRPLASRSRLRCETPPLGDLDRTNVAPRPPRWHLAA
jgi:hypothetical protein